MPKGKPPVRTSVTKCSRSCYNPRKSSLENASFVLLKHAARERGGTHTFGEIAVKSTSNKNFYLPPKKKMAECKVFGAQLTYKEKQDHREKTNTKVTREKGVGAERRHASERACACMCVYCESMGKRECVCVCAQVCVSVGGWVGVDVGMGMSMCVCVCVCVCVCARASARALSFSLACVRMCV